jgi:hypothetical protein
MKNSILLTMVFACAGLVAFSGCTPGAAGSSSNTGSSSGSSSSGSGTTDITANSPLFITLTTQYDAAASGSNVNNEPIVSRGSCYIDPSNLAANLITCRISIPEGELHYSKTTFVVGTNNTTLCPRIEFAPYYRLMSTADFIPYGQTSQQSCSQFPIPAGCYDGAAVEIVPEFPKNTRIWYPTDLTPKQTFIANSSWAARSYGNTHICNNLPVASRATYTNPAGIPQIFDVAAGEYQDYYVACYDPYQGTLFSITMTIEDLDTNATPTNPGFDEFYDWN